MFASTLLSFHILFFTFFTATFAQDVQQDLVTISRRRIDAIIGLSSSQYPGIATWSVCSSFFDTLVDLRTFRLQRMNAEGKFSDIDYTTGCAARRANWPAQLHWARLCMFFTLLCTDHLFLLLSSCHCGGMAWGWTWGRSVQEEAGNEGCYFFGHEILVRPRLHQSCMSGQRRHRRLPLFESR